MRINNVIGIPAHCTASGSEKQILVLLAKTELRHCYEAGFENQKIYAHMRSEGKTTSQRLYIKLQYCLDIRAT
jgi:hypothetical protein